MSYKSSVSGNIFIDPPIPTELLRDSWFADEFGGLCVELDDDGAGTVIVPTREDGYTHDGLVESLTGLAEEFELTGDRATGWLIRCGEHANDIARLRINEHGAIVSEEAVSRWPDGTLVEL